MAAVLWIRWRDHQPLFKGDQNHLAHRLVKLGMSEFETNMWMALATLVIGVGSLLLYFVSSIGMWLIFAQTVGLLLCLYFLERAGARK